MNESEPRQQQHWSRTRITADGQTSRRPRAVAGQRAAAKRATVIEPRAPINPVEPVEPEVTEPDVTEPETAEPEVAQSATKTKLAKTEVANTEVAKIKVAKSGTAHTTHPARRAIVTAVLALALIAAVAIGAIFTVQYRNVIRTDHARTAAMAAAERAAPVIFSYDYRHLDRDFAKAEAYLTGGFRDQYAKTTQTVVKPTALQYHGIVQAAVAKPADGSAAAVSVVSATPDQVVVLAFIDQSTTSTRVNGTQVDQNRVLLTLTHTSQGWLVSAVDAL